MTSVNVKAANWKQFFLSSKYINYPTNILTKIKDAGSAGNAATKIFTDFSRNPGIAFLSLDASESKLQLFHHPNILGGSWLNEELKLVALDGMGPKATPIHIVAKSLKDVKAKVPKIINLSQALDNGLPIDEIKQASDTFLYKNMVPIPDFLIKTFILLEDTKPITAATVFYAALKQADSNLEP